LRRPARSASWSIPAGRSADPSPRLSDGSQLMARTSHSETGLPSRAGTPAARAPSLEARIARTRSREADRRRLSGRISRQRALLMRSGRWRPRRSKRCARPASPATRPSSAQEKARRSRVLGGALCRTRTGDPFLTIGHGDRLQGVRIRRNLRKIPGSKACFERWAWSGPYRCTPYRTADWPASGPESVITARRAVPYRTQLLLRMELDSDGGAVPWPP